MKRISSQIVQDFLQNESLAFILCSADGIILKQGKGLSKRCPHTFMPQTMLWDHLSSADEKDELLDALSRYDYYVSSPFTLAHRTYFLLCVPFTDADNKAFILCKLEERTAAAEDQTLLHYRDIIEQYNAALIAEIIQDGRQLNTTAEGERISQKAEALVRNRLLLDIYRDMLQIGQEETVLFKPFCAAFCSHVNRALTARESYIDFFTVSDGKGVYLDTGAFIELLLCMLSLYHQNASPETVQFTLKEANGKVHLQTSGIVPDCTDQKRSDLAALLLEIIKRFALHYGGSSFCLRNGDIFTVIVTFSLFTSRESGANESFFHQNKYFSAIERNLQLVLFADR